mgnify:CR=1 FL=1
MAHRHNLSVDECLHNFAFHMYNDPNLTSIPHVLCLPCLQDCEWPWVRLLWVTLIWRKNWQSSWICIHFLGWKQPAQLERPRTVVETAKHCQADRFKCAYTTPPRFPDSDVLQFYGCRSLFKETANVARFTKQNFDWQDKTTEIYLADIQPVL